MNVTFILLTLLGGSLLTFLAGKQWAHKIALLISILAFGISLGCLIQFQNGENVSYVASWMSQPNVSFSLQADGLGLLMVLLTTFLTPIILATGIRKQFQNPALLYALILFMAFAMTGTFLAVDGFVYYIFWELALIPIFFIGLLFGHDTWEKRKKTMMKFFIYTFAGSLFMLVAFVYMYMQTGSFLLTDLLAHPFTGKEQTWIFLAFFLAYAIKIPIFPFHTWQADTYEKAPAMGSMLLSGIMLKMGLYSVLRWQLPLTQNLQKEIQYTVLVLCIIGVIYASLIALRQTHIKRILAYSSMAHVGLIAAAAYTYNAIGYQGVVIQMLAHGIVIVALFYLAEIMYDQYGTYEIREMGGIRSQAVKFASFFLIFMFASIGLPGTFNFIGEFTLLLSISQYNLWMAIFGGTTIILGAYYMLRMFQTAVLGPTNPKTFTDVKGTEVLVLSILAGIVIFFGLYPKAITDILFATLS